MNTAIIRPVVLYRYESSTLTKIEEEKSKIFETKILRKTYGPICLTVYGG